MGHPFIDDKLKILEIELKIPHITHLLKILQQPHSQHSHANRKRLTSNFKASITKFPMLTHFNLLRREKPNLYRY